jgi:SAM-dependent methyltransferase
MRIEMEDEPFAFRQYEELAQAYAERIDTKPHNAYYERPAMLSLLPEVGGLKVLDAGCGPGAYSEWLVKQGAEVVAVDFSPRMIEYANRRLKGRIRIVRADLNKPLGFLEGSSFDLVVCPLVLDYISSLRALFGEFSRILVPGGLLIFSLTHPFSDYVAQRQTNYFDTEVIGETWSGFGERVYVSSLRRPISELLNPLVECGFQLQRILEPRPTLQFKDLEPEDYEKLHRKPGFLCIRVQKLKPALGIVESKDQSVSGPDGISNSNL